MYLRVAGARMSSLVAGSLPMQVDGTRREATHGDVVPAYAINRRCQRPFRDFTHFSGRATGGNGLTPSTGTSPERRAAHQNAACPLQLPNQRWEGRPRKLDTRTARNSRALEDRGGAPEVIPDMPPKAPNDERPRVVERMSPPTSREGLRAVSREILHMGAAGGLPVHDAARCAGCNAVKNNGAVK